MIYNQPPILPKILPFRYSGLDTEVYFPPTPDVETMEWLIVPETEDETELLQGLWRITGLPDILNSVPKTKVVQHARTPAQFFFDEVTGKYRYIVSGRIVPDSRIRLSVLRLSNEAKRQMQELTRKLVSKEVSLRQWYFRMRNLMKQEYRAAWIASIGGIQNYDKRQQALFGRAVAPQFRWLNRFLEDLQSGRQKMDGTAIARAGMYARAANAVYQNNLLRVAMENGFAWAKRILGETDHHCRSKGNRKGCVELARGGWTRIENATPIGDASCYSNCLCSFKFRKRRP